MQTYLTFEDAINAGFDITKNDCKAVMKSPGIKDLIHISVDRTGKRCFGIYKVINDNGEVEYELSIF